MSIDSPPAPRVPEIRVTAGGGQQGEPGARLAQDIVVTLLDSLGMPVAGAEVQWSTETEGVLEPSVTWTDANGLAHASWVLGQSVGVQIAVARASGFPAVRVRAEATWRGGSEPGEITMLELQTYDGSGQTVHPDVVSVPTDVAFAGDYLMVTPYPMGNAGYENPSEYVSADRVAWRPPDGVRNPIVTPPGGYLSDPDVVLDPQRREMILYYRHVGSTNDIFATRSGDGVHWSAPALVARAPNHELLSPAVVRRDETHWLMWSVNGREGCSAASASVELRRSSDGVVWSDPTTVTMNQPGVHPWHIEVQWIPSRQEYWAVYNGKTAGSCTTPALFLATSPDGVRWTTYSSPVLARGATAAFHDIVYRATFSYDARRDIITFWYSGAAYERGNYVWHSAMQRRRRDEVFRSIAVPAPASILAADAAVPPLLVAP